MAKNTPGSSEGPTPLGDIIQELTQPHRPDSLVELERRRAAAKLAAENLLRGAVEHHKEMLADPDTDPDVKQDSRRGVIGDEADLLDIDPTTHEKDEP